MRKDSIMRISKDVFNTSFIDHYLWQGWFARVLAAFLNFLTAAKNPFLVLAIEVFAWDLFPLLKLVSCIWSPIETQCDLTLREDEWLALGFVVFYIENDGMTNAWILQDQECLWSLGLVWESYFLSISFYLSWKVILDSLPGQLCRV